VPGHLFSVIVLDPLAPSPFSLYPLLFSSPQFSRLVLDLGIFVRSRHESYLLLARTINHRLKGRLELNRFVSRYDNDLTLDYLLYLLNSMNDYMSV